MLRSDEKKLENDTLNKHITKELITNKIKEDIQPDEDRYYYCEGFDSHKIKQGTPPSLEDKLIELLKNKSGLIDKNNSARTRTDRVDKTVQLQFHYKYQANRELFISEMKKFLETHSKKLEVLISNEITMRFYGKNPTMTFKHSDLETLIEALSQLPDRAPRIDILGGKIKPERPICIFGSPQIKRS